MLPGPPGGFPHQQPDLLRHLIRRIQRLALHLRRKGGLIALHHVLEHVSRRDARQVGAAGRHRQRQPEPHQIMHRIADHRLVQIPHLDRQRALDVGDRADIADMAIPADPGRRPFRQGRPVRRLQPLIEPHRAAAHIGVGRRGHLPVPLRHQQRHPLRRRRDVLLRLHCSTHHKPCHTSCGGAFIQLRVTADWLGDLDSNQGCPGQSQAFYR